MKGTSGSRKQLSLIAQGRDSVSLVHLCGPPRSLSICLENEESWDGVCKGACVPSVPGGCEVAVSVPAPLASLALGPQATHFPSSSIDRAVPH